MREPAWDKRISICSFSHAAILNVWSSHCPCAISPRQRRTRNHRPVPTLTRKVDSESCLGKTTQEPVSCCNQACAAQRFLSLPPAWRPLQRQQSHLARRQPHIRHQRRTRRLHRGLLPHRTSPRRVWRRRHRAQQRLGSPPRRARRHQHPASRRSNSRVLPARPHRPPPHDKGRQDKGRRSGRSSLRRQRNGWEVEAGQVWPSPRCANVRDVSPKSPRNSPRNPRPRNRRQHRLVSRRARADRASRPRHCNRQPPTEPLQVASCAMRL
jgi:hypothetical protein